MPKLLLCLWVVFCQHIPLGSAVGGTINNAQSSKPKATGAIKWHIVKVGEMVPIADKYTTQAFETRDARL